MINEESEMMKVFFDGPLNSRKDELARYAAREDVEAVKLDGPTRTIIVASRASGMKWQLLNSSALVKYWLRNGSDQANWPSDVQLELTFLRDCDIIVFAVDALSDTKRENTTRRLAALCEQLELTRRTQWPPLLLTYTTEDGEEILPPDSMPGISLFDHWSTVVVRPPGGITLARITGISPSKEAAES